MQDQDTPVVAVTGLVNRFGTQIVHDGLDMTVERGEVFGIVGGSGSGKSVLMRSIIGLQIPDAGAVRVFGKDTIGAEPGEPDNEQEDAGEQSHRHRADHHIVGPRLHFRQVPLPRGSGPPCAPAAR